MSHIATSNFTNLSLLLVATVVLFLPALLLGISLRNYGPLRPANPLSRLAAMLLDGYFLGILVLMPGFFLPWRLVSPIAVTLSFSYFFLAWAGKGRTLGQQIAGLRVLDNRRPGRPLRAWQALVRMLLMSLAPVAWVTLPFSKRYALLHDLASSSFIASGKAEVKRHRKAARIFNGILWLVFMIALFTMFIDARPGQWLRPMDTDLAGLKQGRFDTNLDGVADMLAVDADSNGVVELALLDGNGDGILEIARLDYDQDGYGDLLAIDQDGDGVAEIFDVDGDGTADMQDLDLDGKPDARLTEPVLVPLLLILLGLLVTVRLALDFLSAGELPDVAVLVAPLKWRLLWMVLWLMASMLLLFMPMLAGNYDLARNTASTLASLPYNPSAMPLSNTLTGMLIGGTLVAVIAVHLLIGVFVIDSVRKKQ